MRMGPVVDTQESTSGHTPNHQSPSVAPATHMSASLSCWRAFLQAAWKACSTLMASFADVSKLYKHETDEERERV